MSLRDYWPHYFFCFQFSESNYDQKPHLWMSSPPLDPLQAQNVSPKHQSLRSLYGTRGWGLNGKERWIILITEVEHLPLRISNLAHSSGQSCRKRASCLTAKLRPPSWGLSYLTDQTQTPFSGQPHICPLKELILLVHGNPQIGELAEKLSGMILTLKPVVSL